METLITAAIVIKKKLEALGHKGNCFGRLHKKLYNIFNKKL